MNQQVQRCNNQMNREITVKRVLIAGTKSYIGDSFQEYIRQYPADYSVSEISTIGLEPQPDQFSAFDVVFCVAGIVHIKETRKNRQQYYDINRDLVIKMAKAAKEGGVKQFILLSTMSVYGKTTGYITKETEPHPVNAYGVSKVQADEAIMKLADDSFKFACLRPPIVYGKGCKGNYQSLRKFALTSPIFPDYHNQRSMLFIGNLCEFVKRCIDEEKSGLFFPQNAEYTDTSKMVRLIAECNGKQIRLTKAFNWGIPILKISAVKKVFGDLKYEPSDTVDRFGMEETIRLTESDKEK